MRSRRRAIGTASARPAPFAYAHNFIHGYALVSQRGVPPVEDYSNPLWTFLISPLFAFAPVDPPRR